MLLRWNSLVSLGDSFTEGMDDSYPDGTYRGWAIELGNTSANGQHTQAK